MSNIFYHIGVMDIIFRMKNCLSYVSINVVDLQSSFAVLEFGAVGIRQSRFGIEAFLIPSCHHFQELRSFLQLIGSHNGWILCCRIIPQITDTIEGSQSLIFHVHEEDFRCGRVKIDALHLRMSLFNKIAVLFNIFKSFHLSVPVGSLYQVATPHWTVCIVGRQKRWYAVVASVYSSLLFCFLRLCCKVLRSVGWPELIQALECTFLCQRCKVQPCCAVCHIEFLS